MKIIRRRELKRLHDEIERLRIANEEIADWKRWYTMAESTVKELKVEIEEMKKDGVMSQIMPLTRDMSHKEIEYCINISFTSLINYATSFLGVRIKGLKYDLHRDREDCGVYFLELPVSNLDIEFDKKDYKPTKISNEKK